MPGLFGVLGRGLDRLYTRIRGSCTTKSKQNAKLPVRPRPVYPGHPMRCKAAAPDLKDLNGRRLLAPPAANVPDVLRSLSQGPP